jgi:hypothetical protein
METRFLIVYCFPPFFLLCLWTRFAFLLESYKDRLSDILICSPSPAMQWHMSRAGILSPCETVICTMRRMLPAST